MSTYSRRERRKVTPTFNAEAVVMLDASEGQITKVARELKIHDSSLGNWVRRAREEANGAPTIEEHAEIRELRGVLEPVRRERGIPGKAALESSGQCNASEGISLGFPSESFA